MPTKWVAHKALMPSGLRTVVRCRRRYIPISGGNYAGSLALLKSRSVTRDLRLLPTWGMQLVSSPGWREVIRLFGSGRAYESWFYHWGPLQISSLWSEPDIKRDAFFSIRGFYEAHGRNFGFVFCVCYWCNWPSQKPQDGHVSIPIELIEIATSVTVAKIRFVKEKLAIQRWYGSCPHGKSTNFKVNINHRIFYQNNSLVFGQRPPPTATHMSVRLRFDSLRISLFFMGSSIRRSKIVSKTVHMDNLRPAHSPPPLIGKFSINVALF